MQQSNQLSFQIQNLAALLNKASDRILQKKLGIGMSQLKILRAIQADPHVLQQQIARSLNQTEASISRQVRLLKKKQLLVTLINPKDRRQHVTSLSPHGQRLVEASLEIIEVFQNRFIVGVSKKQQGELIMSLESIEQHLLRLH